MTSPWDGRSRTPLRVGIALVAAFDACLMAVRVATAHPDQRSITRAGAAVFLWLGGRSVVVVPLTLLVLSALFMFGRRRRSLLAGAGALVGLLVMSTALTLLQGHASRNFYTCGAVLFGWLCGELAAPAGQRDASRVDALAEAGAAGGLAVTYFAAGVSKMMARGLVWAKAASLQSLVLAQHPIVDGSWLGSYAHAIAHSSTLAMTLTIATLVVELGAVAYVIGARSRMIWGGMIIAFHLNVFMLTGILYLENILLAGLLSFPWPLFRRRGVPAIPEQAVVAGSTWRDMAAPTGLLLLSAVGVGFIPAGLRPVGDPFAKSDHKAHSSLAGPVLPKTFGPLRVGGALADAWTIERIEPHSREVRVGIARGTSHVVLVLSLDKSAHHPGPFSTDGVDVSYRSTTVPVSAFAPAARSLVHALEAKAGPDGLRAAVQRWLDGVGSAGSPR